MLLHPGEDRWTDPQLSLDFLDRLAGSTLAVSLDGCGHFPLEEPGFQAFLEEVAIELQEVRQDSSSAADQE